MRREAEYGQGKARANLEKGNTNSLAERMKKLAISGGISGAVLGGATSLLGGARGLGGLLKGAGLGAATSAGLTVGGNLLGTPFISGEEDDSTINTKRGVVGGALAGGLAGYGAGSILGADSESRMLRMARNAIMKQAESGSLLRSGMMAASRNPKVAAITGLLGGGLAGSFMAADEGMQYDTIKNEMQDRADQAQIDRQNETREWG